jgi:hypothetical protein
LRLRVLRFTPELVAALGAYPGARVPDPFREARRIAAVEPRERVAAAARAYEALVAPEHRDEVLAPLRARLDESPAALRARLAAGSLTAAALRDADERLPPAEAASWAARYPARWTLDDGAWPAGTEVRGTAFGPGPAAAALPQQEPVRGTRGAGFADSFHGGDAATGRVALPPFVAGGVVSFLVGGGGDCRRVRAGVEVDGKMVATACGRDDEELRTVVVDTAPWAGKLARLVLADESKGPWGHLLVDDVIVEPAPAAGREDAPPR